MLLTALGNQAYLPTSWVARDPVKKLGQLSVFQSNKPGSAALVSCPTLDPNTLRYYQCASNYISEHPDCEYLFNFATFDGDHKSEGHNCTHLVTLNSTSQQATIHNNLDSSTTWSIAFNVISETISVMLDEDGMREPVEAIISEYFELAAHKSISFPFQMFVPAQPSPPTVQFKSELVKNLYMCDRLLNAWKAFQLPASTFVIQSDNTYVHSEHSLMHWLDVCDIRAPTVYMYHSDNDYLFDTVESSRCTVLKVTGVRSVDCVSEGGSNGSDGSDRGSNGNTSVDTCVNSSLGPVHPVCMQDVMYHLTTNSTSLHYVSSVSSVGFGMTSSGASVSSIATSGRKDYSVLGFRDLLAVLHAYTTAEVTVPLVLHSLVKDGMTGSSGTIDAGTSKLTRTLSRQLLSAMMVLANDPEPAAAFQQALSTFSNSLHTLFDTTLNTSKSVDNDTITSGTTNYSTLHTWHTGALLLDLLTLHFGERGAKFVQRCASQVAGDAILSYVCASEKARAELSNVIMSHIIDSDDGSVYVLVSHITNVTNALLFGRTNAHSTHTIQEKPNKPQVNIVVAGDVFVMMFVRPALVPLVQELVYHWQRGGADHTNFLFVKYMIFPVYDVDGGSDSDSDMYDTPSLHSVLSIVEESIQHIAAVKDIVYVLNGMQAILSFPQPGRTLLDAETVLRKQCSTGSLSRDSVVCDSSVVNGNSGAYGECNLCKHSTYSTYISRSTYHSYTPYINADRCAFIEGVVPSVPYGWSALLRLQAGVMVGAGSDAHSGSSGSRSGTSRSDAPWNFNTMVGIGYRLLDMITTVRGTSLSSGNSSGTIVMEASLHSALTIYAETHPADVLLDCNQHAFHDTKGNLLMQMLQLQHKHSYVSYTMLPYLRHVNSMPLSNDSVATLASVLGVVVRDGSATVSITAKHSAGYIGTSIHNTNYTLDSLLHSYRKYRPPLNTLLHAYMDSTEGYAELTHLLSGNIEYADVLLPLLKTSKIPLGTHYISSSVQASNGIHDCYIEKGMQQAISEHIFNEMYVPSDTSSALLSVVGLIHQSVVCQCEDLSYALDEAVYIMIRIGQLAKYVTFSIHKDEYIISMALLENYETMLLGLFANTSSTSDGSGSGNSNSKYSSAHNPVYGTVLHADSTVFTPRVRHLYNTLDPFYQDQILVALRFAISGLAQELAVYPALVYSMHSAYKVGGYSVVREGRCVWYKQREVLRQSLDRQESGPGSSSGGSSGESIETSCTASVVNATGDAQDDTLTPNTTSNTTTTTTTSTTTTAPPLPTIRTHYVTYGSDLTEGLQNLLESARLAGVTIEVLGLGTHYADYMSKTDAYLNYLINSTGPHTRSDNATIFLNTTTVNTTNTTSAPAAPVPEDDVVVFMDAYDVLVYPSLVKAARVLAESRSPLVFCAERGVYPEFAGSFFYNRGAAQAYNTTYTSSTHPNTAHEVDLGYTVEGGVSTVESSAYSQKFLNSGCLLGRAGQLRHLLQYAKNYSRTYRDDQLAMVRYHHEFPSIVALDTANKLFATSFKLATAPQDMLLTYDLRLYQGSANIGLLHSNNHKSGIVYASMVHNMRTIAHMYYQGEEGALLLQAIHHYSHNRLHAASALLQHPTILKNCTSRGGANPMRQFILKRMKLDETGVVGGNHPIQVMA